MFKEIEFFLSLVDTETSKEKIEQNKSRIKGLFYTWIFQNICHH